MSFAEVVHILKKIYSKYQVPFGIAIWGFAPDGTAKEILVDSQGRIIVTGEVNVPNVDIPLSSLQVTRVYEQTFEDGTTDTTTSNVTQAVQSDVVYAGTYALQVIVPAGQTGYVETPTRPVSPGQQVKFSFAHREDENIVGVKLAVVWYRPNMKIIAVDEFDLTPSTSWQIDSRVVTAPQNSAYMALRMEATASDLADGNVYLDDMFMDLVGQIIRVNEEGRILVSSESTVSTMPHLHLFGEFTTTTTPVETDPVDLTAFAGPKMLVLYNGQDVVAYVDVYASLTIGGVFYPVRTGIRLEPGDVKVGIMRDRHPVIKLRMWSDVQATEGSLQPALITWSL